MIAHNVSYYSPVDASVVPAYIAYPAPDLTCRTGTLLMYPRFYRHWFPSTGPISSEIERACKDPGQERDLSSFQNMMRRIKSARPLNIQSFVYFRMRCILTGGPSKDFENFGGGVAQPNLLGIWIRLAIKGSPFVATEYGRLINRRGAALSRGIYNGAGTLGYTSPQSTDQAEIIVLSELPP